jgi:hypothetical protein
MHGTYEIEFTRFSTDGQAEPMSVISEIDELDSIDTDLVCTGDRLGVSWVDNDRRDLKMYACFGVFEPDGTAVGTRHCVSDTYYFRPLVAPATSFDGQHFGLCWPDNRNGAIELYFALIDKDGTPMGEHSHLAVDSTAAAFLPQKMAWTDGVFGVAFVEFYQTLGQDRILFAPVSCR